VSYGYEPLAGVNVAKRGRGELVALDATNGKRLWTRRLPQPDFGCATAADGVVFTSTFDGTSTRSPPARGETLERPHTRRDQRLPGAAGKELLVGAGPPRRGGVVELEAFTTADGSS
jgi:outer membrane protein assembly factor BamB